MWQWFARKDVVDSESNRQCSPEPLEPINPQDLPRLANIQNYGSAQPFPHLVIDNLFDPRALDLVLSEWPSSETANFENYHDGTYTKLKFGSNYRTKLGLYTRFLLTYLAEPLFLEALEKATGIVGLIPDPYLLGGGIHMTRSGGKLAVHSDFQKHPKLNLDRRLNLLLYLNRGWSDANQGWLELWDVEMKSRVQRILPVFNRMVVFSTTHFSFHGQPEPTQGPPDLLRKSIALYYYSNGRPAEEISERDPLETLWRERGSLGY